MRGEPEPNRITTLGGQRETSDLWMPEMASSRPPLRDPRPVVYTLEVTLGYDSRALTEGINYRRKR